MAASYQRIITNDTVAGQWIIDGWKTKVPERTTPWSFRLRHHGPWYQRTYYGQYVNSLSTLANHWSSGTGAGGFQQLYFGKTESQMLTDAAFAAFEKFKAKCGDSAQLGATLAEGKEAFSMITSRATQLFKAARSLKRLRFGDFARELKLAEPGHQIKRKWQRSGHDLGSVWLEYSYGWKPLVGDIHDAVQVLQNPYKDCVVRGNGTSKVTGNINYRAGGQTMNGTAEAIARYQYGATVAVSNPNLALAQQLGLVNPLSVAWEIVPFSFVIDWFTPVGNFLQNMTFGLGLTLSKKWATSKVFVKGNGIRLGTYNTVAYPPLVDVSMYLDCNRTTSWTTPKLPRPRFPSFPRDRALNALSLCVTMLSSLQSGLDRSTRR